MAVIVRKLISDGISKGIWFRGAIGVGKYFADLEHDTIIGQAVSDAAGWYEASNFVGCVLTPKLEFVLKKHLSDDKLNPKGVYMRFPVSTKEGVKEMFCVNWPLAFHFASLRPKDCKKGQELQYLYKKIGECFFPKTADEKFHNTVAFFKESFARLSEAENAE